MPVPVLLTQLQNLPSFTPHSIKVFHLWVDVQPSIITNNLEYLQACVQSLVLYDSPFLYTTSETTSTPKIPTPDLCVHLYISDTISEALGSLE